METKMLCARIPQAAYEALKIKVVRSNQTMQDYVVAMVEREIREVEQKGPDQPT